MYVMYHYVVLCVVLCPVQGNCKITGVDFSAAEVLCNILFVKANAVLRACV